MVKVTIPIDALPPRPETAAIWLGDTSRRSLAGPAVLVAAIAAGTIGTVWAIQHAGYVPCELCLKERQPFYAGVPLALLTAGAAWAGRRALAAGGFALLALAFMAGAGLAVYHAGVEWGFWAGPTGCSGPITSPTTVADFLAALKTVKVVRCDTPALVVLGLSLAAWNVPLSLLLAAVSGYGAWAAWRPPGS